MKEYPCPLSTSGVCKMGGNKHYNYGFLSGTASYCRKVGKWVVDIKKCPLVADYLKEGE
jgi:hypothetical protein